MPRHPASRYVLILLSLLVAFSCGASASTFPSPEPLPALTTLAATEHIPLTGIDAPHDDATLQPGDAVTVLFSLREDSRVRQWLAEIKVVAPTDAELRAKSAETVIYTGIGNEIHLASPAAAYALRVFGPIDDRPQPTRGWPVKTARFTVKQDYLGFGFDRMCELALRLRPLGEEIRIGFMTGRFQPDAITWGKSWAEKVGFTREDELVCAKQAFACVEFLMLADRTPGFKEITAAAIKRPSLIKAFLTGKLSLFFSYDWQDLARHEGAGFGLADPVYYLPFRLKLFGEHVANGAWLVTKPRPPLLASAGIYGLSVTPPDTPSKRLDIRIIAARCASH